MGKYRVFIVAPFITQYIIKHAKMKKIAPVKLYSTKHISNTKINLQDPIIMKLDTPEFKSLFTVELITLAAIFRNHNYELRIAGGAVRDLLLDKKPKDLDFATNATPEQMKAMFEKEKIRMINNKGEKHGTITPRINNKENFEITTLRIDKVTDGRHAEVQFTQDWKLDANRRDLTINSMYLGMDGTLYDYFHGYDDLKKRRIVFVGDARNRIQEDYLRILRYFRFFGRISYENSHHDNDTIQAIKENGQGLANISGERIWMEMSSILSGNLWGDIMDTIIDCGLASYLGLPKEPDVIQFRKLYKDVKYVPLRPITKMTGLIKTEDQFADLNKRLKLSSFDRDLGFFIVNHREENINLRWCKYKTVMLQQRTKLSNLQDWIQEVLKYKCENAVLYEYTKWDVPRFPVSGGMLKDHGIPMDRNTAKVLNKLKEYWIDQDCAVDADQILTLLPSVLEEIKMSSNQA